MKTAVGGKYNMPRQDAVIIRTIQFLLWAAHKENSDSQLTCESLLPWMHIVLCEELHLLSEYVEYLELKKYYVPTTISGHLYDLE
jgi:hypothetical protein